MKPHEVQNRIYQVEAGIEQMKNSEIFSENEKAESLKSLDKELKNLKVIQRKLIDTKTTEVN